MAGASSALPAAKTLLAARAIPEVAGAAATTAGVECAGVVGMAIVAQPGVAVVAETIATESSMEGVSDGGNMAGTAGAGGPPDGSGG